MPLRTFIEAIRDGCAEEMRRDETRHRPRRGRRQEGRRLPGHRRAVGRVRRRPGHRHAADRVDDRRAPRSGPRSTACGRSPRSSSPTSSSRPSTRSCPRRPGCAIARTTRFGVPMTIRAPYGGGVHGALYHSQSVEAFFTHVPGLKVVIPSTPYDAKGLLRSSIRDDDPVLFFEHKKMYRSVRGDVPDGDYTVPLGRGRGHPPGLAGHDRRVRADGPLRARGGRPRRRGRDQRRGRRPADAPAARPRDAARQSVRKTGKCLVVYEDNKFGGYGAEIAAIVAEEAFDYLDGPVTRIAGPDVPGVPVQPRPRGLVHGQPGEDRRRHPQARRVLRRRFRPSRAPSRAPSRVGRPADSTFAWARVCQVSSIHSIFGGSRNEPASMSPPNRRSRPRPCPCPGPGRALGRPARLPHRPAMRHALRDDHRRGDEQQERPVGATAGGLFVHVVLRRSV